MAIKTSMFKQIINFLKGPNNSPTSNIQNPVVEERQNDDKANVPESTIQESPVDSKPGPRRRAKDLLAEYGIKRIKSQDDVNRIFWEMATRRMPVAKDIANAVRIVICDNRQMKSFNRKLELYNKFMDSKLKDHDFQDDKQKMKDMAKAHREEVIRLNQTINREVKEKNIIKQKLEQEDSANRKVATKFMNQLKTHQGRFLQSYDFTKERDVVEFLSWFKIMRHPVSKRTINSILKHHIGDSESSSVFLNLVEQHNAQFQTGKEDELE